MDFDDYDPQHFAAVYARVGARLCMVFSQASTLTLLKNSVKVRRPAVEAVEEHLLTELPDELQDHRVRQLVGHMIRHLMEKHGFVIDQPEVRIPDGVIFTCGARYRAADGTAPREWPIAEAEAMTALQFVNRSAALYTDVLLHSKPGSNAMGVASCLHIQRGDRNLVVTCHHVIAGDRVCFTTPRRLAKDIVEEGDRRKVQQLRVIASSRELDLAVLDGTELDLDAARKRRYAANKSAWFSRERLQPDGTAAYIYGVWGDKASGCQYPDGLVYVNAPIYTGVGPIVRADEQLLVADFAEVKFLQLGERFKHDKPTGGVRELHGISGSGLWMILDHQVCLAGVVLGREPSRTDEHLLRVTPVWALLAWLDEVLK